MLDWAVCLLCHGRVCSESMEERETNVVGINWSISCCRGDGDYRLVVVRAKLPNFWEWCGSLAFHRVASK